MSLAYPAAFGTLTSFFSDASASRESEFVGFANYKTVLGNPKFWNSLQKTLIFVFGTIVLAQLLAVAFALLLQRAVGSGRIFRGVVIIPYLVTGIAAAEFWRVLFHTSLGLPNIVLKILGLGPAQWLGSTTNAMVVIILATTWVIAPLAMLIVFAGLQAIDPDYLDAAAVDGASVWQRFRYVTVPLISRQLMLSLLWISFSAFSAFAVIMRLTGGGPAGATETLSLQMYFTAFGRFRFAEGMSIMVVLLIINALLSLIYIRFMDTGSD